MVNINVVTLRPEDEITDITKTIYRNELPETLLSSLQSSSSLLTVHRSLLFLHATLKILSSNRMMKGRSLMSQLAQYLFNPLRNLHATILASAVERLKRDGFSTVPGEDAGGETEEIECALLTFKCLRYLIIYGYRDPSEDEEVRVSFLPALFNSSILFCFLAESLVEPISLEGRRPFFFLSI